MFKPKKKFKSKRTRKSRSNKSRTKQRGGYRSHRTRKSLSCSPQGKEDPEGTCLDTTTIQELYKDRNLHDFQDSVQMMQQLREKSSCKNDICIVKKSNLPKDAKVKGLARFAPLVPSSWFKNKNEWLSSEDILHVMKQYEDFYKCFEFIGPSAIDFDLIEKDRKNSCVCNKLCNFSLEKYRNSPIRKIGIIFNLDTSQQSGSHWVSLFLQIEKHKCSAVFFDSTGEQAPKEVKILVDRIQNQAEQIGLEFTFLDVLKIHQNLGTECGVYSLYFIINMLQNKNKTVHDLLNHSIPDEIMQKNRNRYFNFVR
jgi:hypothetical protein